MEENLAISRAHRVSAIQPHRHRQRTEAVVYPTEGEREFAQGCTQTNQHAFCFLALLKCFQRLHYFPSMKEIPAIIVDHLRSFLHLRPEVPLAYENRRTLYRHCDTIRSYLGIKTFAGKKSAIPQCRQFTELRK